MPGAVRTAVALAAGALAAASADASSIVSIEAYGNQHTAGVVAVVSGDTNGNATVALEWGTGTPSTAAHPLVRTDPTRFVGSLFRLSPGTSYQVRVTLSDPDGVTGAPSMTAAFATRTDVLAPTGPRTWYVAPTGDDGNVGTTPAQALRTIQEAANRTAAGDLVSIAPGVYRESVSVPASGTALAPIVYRGSGDGVVLDGADAAIAAGVAWTAEANGVHARVLGFATGHVVTELGRLFRYDSLADLAVLGAGAPGGFFFDGTTLRVKFANGSAPGAHTMHVARLEDGFVLDGRAFVRIENLVIRHYGAGDFGKGVYLRYSSDCAVRSSLIHENGAAGVWIKGGTRHLIEENDIFDTSIPGWPWDFTKGSSAENNGIVFTDDVGRGHIVRRNNILGTFNGIGPCGGSAPPVGYTSEVDVYDNDLSLHNDDALEPEGYCANVRIFYNRIHDVHMAVAAAPAAPGPLWIVRNVAWRFGNTRTSQQDGYLASALKINNGFATPVGPVLLYHNTFLTDAPGTDAIALLSPGSGTLLRARNNLIAGTRYALYKVNPIPWDGNFNDLYTTDPVRFVSWLGTSYPTLGAYQAAQGQELSGLSVPPQLVNPAGGDFRLAAGSPLIDRGVVLPGINDGWNGAAPDVGGLEAAAAAVPSLAIADVAQAEGTSPFAFTVALAPAATATVIVGYATVAGTAAAGADFTPAAGTLTFAAGATSATVPIAVVGDALDEPSEQFTVLLSGASGASLGDATAVGTIADDDPPAALSVADASAAEPSCGGAAHLTFTVTLAPVSGQTATVSYETVSGTATAGLDFAAVSGTLTFAPGTTQRSVSVPLVDDLLDEGDETFTLHLSVPANATVADADAVGIITDADGGPAGLRGELAHGSLVAGDLRAADGPVDDYAAVARPFASYEIVADAVSADVDPLVLRRVACDGATVQDSFATGTGNSRALRWLAGASPVANERIRVASAGCSTTCGPDDAYRLRAYETTASAPRFNNSATQGTVLVLQNATGAPVNGTARFWSASGALLGAHVFALAGRASLALDTTTVPGVAGASGSITVAHDGPYGGLTGKAVALEPSTGYSFDTPLEPRRR
ncbi:MAG: Calx-beta domain-containing protein [Vicinamibacteria bacterium]